MPSSPKNTPQGVRVKVLSAPKWRPTSFKYSWPALLARGADLYASRCAMCHGGGASSGGAITDLRYSTEAVYGIFDEIVREGAYAGLRITSYNVCYTKLLRMSRVKAG